MFESGGSHTDVNEVILQTPDIEGGKGALTSLSLSLRIKLSLSSSVTQGAEQHEEGLFGQIILIHPATPSLPSVTNCSLHLMLKSNPQLSGQFPLRIGENRILSHITSCNVFSFLIIMYPPGKQKGKMKKFSLTQRSQHLLNSKRDFI